MSVNFFEKLPPYLAGIAQPLINADENETGADDLVGQILMYAAEVIQTVTLGTTELPPLPAILAQPIEGKISGTARVAIMAASGGLTVAEFQLAATKPRVAKALGYVRQVLAALSAGRPVPAAPSALL